MLFLLFGLALLAALACGAMKTAQAFSAAIMQGMALQAAMTPHGLSAAVLGQGRVVEALVLGEPVSSEASIKVYVATAPGEESMSQLAATSDRVLDVQCTFAPAKGEVSSKERAPRLVSDFDSSRLEHDGLTYVASMGIKDYRTGWVAICLPGRAGAHSPANQQSAPDQQSRARNVLIVQDPRLGTIGKSALFATIGLGAMAMGLVGQRLARRAEDRVHN
jgi:hypothetical protein